LWRLELTTNPLSAEKIATLEAFFDSQEGRFGTFTFNINDAIKGRPLGAGGGTPLVDGDHLAGVSSVTSDGWPNSTTVLKKGDFIKFASHDKTYRLTSDATSDGSGMAVLSFKPALMVAVDNNTAITYADVTMKLSFEQDELAVTRTPGQFDQLTMAFVEAWNS
jgi:hypothetical protein